IARVREGAAARRALAAAGRAPSSRAPRGAHAADRAAPAGADVSEDDVVRSSGEDLDGAGSGLVSRAAAGLAWVFSSMILARLVTFASMAVLARLLDPTAFGVLAMPMLVITY